MNKSMTETVKRKRCISLMDQLKVAKKYCFDDLEFDELDETDIPGKCSTLIRKIIDEGPSISKLEAIAYCLKKLKGNGLSNSVSFDEVFNLVTKLDENIKNRKDDEVMSHSVYVSLLIYANDDMPTALYVEDFINNILTYFMNQSEEVVAFFGKKSGYVKKRSNSVPRYTGSLIKNLKIFEEFVRIKRITCNNFLYYLLGGFVKIIFYGHVHDLQIRVVDILKSFFEKREDLRKFILNEIFGTIKKLPENYKFVKNFGKVSMFTVLLLNLVQCFGCGLQGTKITEGTLRESYENLFKICGLFAVTFVKEAENHREVRGVLEVFLGEILEISNEPEWPAGKIVLQMIAKPLTEIAKNGTDVMMRVFAIKLINKIAVKKLKEKAEFEGRVGEILEEFKDVEEFDDLEIAQILLVLYLKDEKSKYVHQVEWFENVKSNEDKKGFVLNLEQRSKLINRKINEEEAKALTYYVDTKRFNYPDFHIFLNYILNSCYDANKKIKGVGAQCLAELVTIDANLLSKRTVSKTMSECLSASSAIGREAIVKLLGKFLRDNLEKTEEYNGYLLRMLGDESVAVKKACITSVQNLILKKWDVPYAKELTHRILGMIQDEDVQPAAIGFCEKIWFEESHIDSLLQMVDLPNALKNLRLLLERKLKPKATKVTEETQTEPETEPTEKLVEGLLVKMKEERLSPVKMFSVIATVYPKILIKHFSSISEPLNEAEYTKDFAVEILTAETLNYILPEMVAPDVLALIMLIDKLTDKLTGPEFYSTGFLISVLKLLKNLAAFGEEGFLREKIYRPNLKIINEYLKTGKSDDLTTRAISITIYLHPEFEDEFPLEKLLNDPTHCLTAIHSVCYLSLEYKPIMRNGKLQEIIAKYLKDKKKYVLTQAVLHNILCALKNVANDDEIISGIIQKYYDDVLECVLDPNFEIRRTSSVLIAHVLKSGLSIDRKVIPYVVAMSADPIPEINKIGGDLLKSLDFSRSPQRGIIMSQKLLLKLSGREHARGYREQNGRLESRCNLLYVLHREDESKRRRLTESILNELKPESSTSATEKLYLADHLASFPYKYQDEILYLLRQIDHIKSVVSVPEENFLLDRYYGLYLLAPLRKYLQKLYLVNDLKVSKYYGVEGKKDLITKRDPHAEYFVALPQNLTPEDVLDAVKTPDITDTSSQSSLEDPPPKSVLKEKLINERFTKSEQKPKKRLNDSFQFNSAKKFKTGKSSSNGKVAKSLF